MRRIHRKLIFSVRSRQLPCREKQRLRTLRHTSGIERAATFEGIANPRACGDFIKPNLNRVEGRMGIREVALQALSTRKLCLCLSPLRCPSRGLQVNQPLAKTCLRESWIIVVPE